MPGAWADPTLALLVLVVEIAKGLAAVVAGMNIAGETAALAAGLGAVTGNVYNVWYRFQGGKGLGISCGWSWALACRIPRSPWSSSRSSPL